MVMSADKTKTDEFYFIQSFFHHWVMSQDEHVRGIVFRLLKKRGKENFVYNKNKV